MKAKKYYQTPASRVVNVKVKVLQPLQDSDHGSKEEGDSRRYRGDWGED